MRIVVFSKQPVESLGLFFFVAWDWENMFWLTFSKPKTKLFKPQLMGVQDLTG